MAENSETSTRSGKRNTKSTAKLTPAEALQILQSAAAMCQDSGLVVERATFFDRGTQKAAVIITNAEWLDGNLICTTNGTGAE